jgi:hypothetical protein
MRPFRRGILLNNTPVIQPLLGSRNIGIKAQHLGYLAQREIPGFVADDQKLLAENLAEFVGGISAD